MKKILIPLLVLAVLCASLSALAEGGDAVTLELNTARLPVYAADDPYLNGLTAGEGTLPVIVLFAKKSLTLQVNVLPKTVRNKRVTLTADNEETVRVKGNALTGLQPGEAVLTIASQEDPSVTVQYRIAVIQPVTRISLSASEKSVAVGKTMALTPAYLPENATLKQVTWSSANEQIATVDENGVVTGVKRGTTRIVATAADGSKIRANINIKVTQSAEGITLDKTETTVDIGRNTMLKATVAPKDTDNKKVSWSSSDESIATVNAQGRITGVALGDCEIICTSQEVDTVLAKAVVHVQQPVKKVTFSDAPAVYNGETAQLTWTVEPADASNPKLKFTSANEKVVTVDENGVITGVAGGDTYINAVTTDGSNRQARVRVKVYQHLTGVHMLRHTAYIDPGQTSGAGAVLEPEKAKNVNPNMTWEIADPAVATVEPVAKTPNKVNIKGIAYGETVITGTTEDGGFQTTLKVRIGDWENSLKWKECKYDGRGKLVFVLENISDLEITSVSLAIEFYDSDGNPISGMNTKDGTNTVKATYGKTLEPGKRTPENKWKMVNYNEGLAEQGFSAIVVRVADFQIENDWVKTVRKNNRRLKITYDPHKVLK